MASAERVHLLGIRHHGPGSSRSLIAALDRLRPDVILIEGPPEAEPLLPLVLRETMCPPVALLVYAANDPAWAAHYPFAEYSPEWQAIRRGLAKGVPVRLFDLSQSAQMALWRDLSNGDAGETAADRPGKTDFQDGQQGSFHGEAPVPDPMQLLAEAAGYSESELWWEHLVEQRRDPGDVFAAILEAMTALRESIPPETHPVAVRREAAMRQNLRAALAEGFERIAVVCGAWHVPALVDLTNEAADLLLLAHLPSLPVRATWVPWTNARLMRGSGYGAGIEAPGWYAHLWTAGDDVANRWMIRVARLMREEDLDVTPAHVIEAVRLSEALAALRGRPLPGLPELNQAAQSVFCMGSTLPMRLIQDRLILGDALGTVPPETPMAPLQADFERQVKRLKIQPEAHEQWLDLDLRRPLDLARSHLLHRLLLLEIPWGRNNGAELQPDGHGRGGTFHEGWRLKWQPEFAVLLIEAGQWGSTLVDAASAYISRAAAPPADLLTLTQLVEDALLADLPQAVGKLTGALRAQSVVSGDTRLLMQSLPPLVSILRYGNVRQTDRAAILEVADSIASRIWIGLPGACADLNDDAAAEMFALILKVDEAVLRISSAVAEGQGEDRYRRPWLRALEVLSRLPHIHGMLQGRASRILLDYGVISPGEASQRLGLGLSAAAPDYAAAWVEGFLSGSGELLIHDDALLGILDEWLCRLPETTFILLLPLLRRTFASFAPSERRGIGERVRRSGNKFIAGAADHSSPEFDPARASAVLPLLTQLLGLPHEEQGDV